MLDIILEKCYNATLKINNGKKEADMGFYTYFTKHGGKVYERYVENGERKERLVELEPQLFIETKEKTDIKSLYGKNLKPIAVDGVDGYREKKAAIENAGRTAYGFEPLEYDYITEIYGLECPYKSDEILVFTLDIETEIPDNDFPDKDLAEQRINVVTIHHSLEDRYYVFTFRDFDLQPVVTIPSSQIVKKVYSNERAMLIGLLEFWQAERPDVLSGWFTSGFDVAYLYNRVKGYGIKIGKKNGEDLFSLVGKTIEKKDGDIVFKGVSHLDYMSVMRKFNAGERSWSLNSVSEEFLGDVQKVKNPYSNFKDFYTKAWDLFVTYNIRDVELVVRLMRKTKQLELIYSLAYLTGCNYEDVMGTLKPWEIYIQNVLKQENVFLSVGDKTPGDEGSIMGGYVKDPIPDKYHWLVSFDQNSLYPSILRTWNVSPETIVDSTKLPIDLKPYANKIYTEIPRELPALLKRHNLTMTANGQFFIRDKQGVLAKMSGHVYEQRVATKNAMKKLKKENYEKGIKDTTQIDVLDHKQHALKILLNSLYGALANRYFAFFDFRCAEGITSTGQYIIKRITENVGRDIDKVAGVNGSLAYVDTDSGYFSLDAVIKKITRLPKLTYSDELITAIDNFCNGFIAPRIDKENKAIGDDLNAPFNCLAMKREKICESGFWAAKKRYAIKAWDDEGLRLKEPKYAITGLEIKRSSTPKFAQKKLMEMVVLLLSDKANEAPHLLEKFRKEFNKAGVLEIGLPMGVSSMISEVEFMSAKKKPVIPQHIRGAIIYNQLLEIYGLQGTHRAIGNGTKIYRYLLKPNPFLKLFSQYERDIDARLDGGKIDVICIPQEMEDGKIIGLFEDYIDKERMFGVALGEAAIRMIEACGISTTSNNSLDAFF